MKINFDDLIENALELKVHHAALLEKFLNENRSRIILFLLPLSRIIHHTTKAMLRMAKTLTL